MDWTWFPVFAYFFVGIGILNVTHAIATGTIHTGRHREGTPWAEIAFYTLAWPVQILFWTLVGISKGTEWMYHKLAGE